MRNPEQRQWQYLKNAMGMQWDVQRHEDKHSPAIPDLSYAIGRVDGWIELKTLPQWPKKDDTGVRIGHLTADQLNWLESRGAHGNGQVFVLLAVGEDMRFAHWALIPWRNARAVKEGEFTRMQILIEWGIGRGSEMIPALVDNLTSTAFVATAQR